MRRTLLVLMIPVWLGLGWVPAAGAEGPWQFDAYNELMSPYCPGRTLNDCPSSQAKQLRDWIAAQEAAGRSRADVEEQLYRTYGDVLRSAPRAQGWGLAAYAIPVVGTLLAGAILVVFLRRQAASAPPSAPSLPVDPELERLVDEELRSDA